MVPTTKTVVEVGVVAMVDLMWSRALIPRQINQVWKGITGGEDNWSTARSTSNPNRIRCWVDRWIEESMNVNGNMRIVEFDTRLLWYVLGSRRRGIGDRGNSVVIETNSLISSWAYSLRVGPSLPVGCKLLRCCRTPYRNGACSTRQPSTRQFVWWNRASWTEYQQERPVSGPMHEPLIYPLFKATTWTHSVYNY
jgi:hypothetical protein